MSRRNRGDLFVEAIRDDDSTFRAVRIWLASAILVLCVLLGAACGGDSQPEPPSSPTELASSAARSSSLAVTPPAAATSVPATATAPPVAATPIVAATAAPPTATPQPANLAANPSFELGGSAPASWTLKGPAASLPVIDATVSHAGQRSVKLDCPVPCGYWSEPIEVQAVRYRAVVWVRILPDPAVTSTVPTFVGLVIRGQLPGHQGNYLPMSSASLPVAGNTTGQWLRLTTEDMPSRQGVTSALIDVFWHHGGGPNPDQSPAGALIWIDDVYFGPVN